MLVSCWWVSCRINLVGVGVGVNLCTQQSVATQCSRSLIPVRNVGTKDRVDSRTLTYRTVWR